MLTLASTAFITGLASYLGKETTITICSGSCCDKSIHRILCEPYMIGSDEIGFSAEECDIYRAPSRVNHIVEELYDVPSAQRKGTCHAE